MEKTYLDYFKEICAIPHGSGNTAALSDYCEAFAKKQGLRYIRERCGNVILFKDAQGCACDSPVILQGHLDMVCVSAPGKAFNFERQGLALREASGFLFAEGTSLGGDDGIAVAYALAILGSKTAVHPPLEVVFTIDEETGMEGASALDMKPLCGEMLINIDSEEEGTLLTSCAGGARMDLTWCGDRSNCEGEALQIELSGLLGGHSGTEIHKKRQNAILLLARLLNEIGAKRVVSLSGGSADNAIPSSAEAVILGGEETARALQSVFQKLKTAFLPEEQSAVLRITKTEAETAFTADATGMLLDYLLGLPNGVMAMSADVPGLVQTSLNLGILKTEGDAVCASFAVRSSVNAEKDALIESAKKHAERFGAACSVHSAYPAWEYCKNSRLRSAFQAAFRAMYGKEMQMTAIHAGLECGIFCGKKPELDCVSMGPDIFDIHSPQERLSLSSAARTYRLLCAVLEELSR